MKKSLIGLTIVVLTAIFGGLWRNNNQSNQTSTNTQPTSGEFAVQSTGGTDVGGSDTGNTSGGSSGGTIPDTYNKSCGDAGFDHTMDAESANTTCSTPENACTPGTTGCSYCSANCRTIFLPGEAGEGDEDDHDNEIITIFAQVTCCDGSKEDTLAECPMDDNGNAEGCHTAPEYTCCDGSVVTDADTCPADTNGAAEGCESQEYDLALTKDLKTGQSRAVTQGDEVTFTITVTNQGDVTANTFEITDHIPVGLTLQDVDWTNVGDNKAEYVVTTPLVAGASIAVDITLLVGDVSGEIVNVAEISVDDGDDIDSDPNNDNGDQSEDDEDPEPLTVIDTEVCDGVDNDNDGTIDEGFEDMAEGETCDDGNDSTINDVYNASCLCKGTQINTGGGGGSAGGGNFCGDGEVFERLGEECDDGNYEDGDGCDRNCKIEPICGDGVPNQATEQCDDGNTVDGDGCSKDCLTEILLTCGDGSPNQDWEQCDDGNTVDGDGCSATCQIESLDQDIVEMILKKKEPIVVPAPVRITTPLILPKTGVQK